MSKAIQVDTKTFIRFWLVIAVLVLLFFLVVKAGPGLLIVGASLFLSVALYPLMKKIDKLNKKKSRPGLSAGIVVGGLVVVIGLIVAVAGPVVVTETSNFLSHAPEQIQATIKDFGWINNLGSTLGIDDAQSQIVSLIKNTVQGILGAVPQTVFESVGAVASFLTGLILTIVLTILFLTQGPALLDAIISKFESRSARAKQTRRILDKVAGVISGYVTGQLFVAMIDGLVTGIAVLLLSLIFGFSAGLAIPMGMIAMIFYMIPMFGPVITCIIVSLLLFFSAPWAGLTFLIFYLIFEQVQGNVIAPRIQGNNLSLPPLVILIAVTLGMYMFGLVGAIVSIPIAGIIKVFVDEYPNLKALNEEN